MNKERKIYLMLRGHNSCSDNDLLIGIFENIDKLRKVYMEKFFELKNEQDEGRYRDFSVQIYEFELNRIDEGERVSPSFLWE